MLLGLYLEALDEELVALQPSIIKHKPASTPKVDELGGEIRSGEGQTEVGERDYTVLQFSISALGLALLMYLDMLGKFIQVSHLAHIRWKVPLDRTRTKPAGHRRRQRLEITQTQHPGPFPLLDSRKSW